MNPKVRKDHLANVPTENPGSSSSNNPKSCKRESMWSRTGNGKHSRTQEYTAKSS